MAMGSGKSMRARWWVAVLLFGLVIPTGETRAQSADPNYRSREVNAALQLLRLNSLAELYGSQGLYDKAEPLLAEALQLSREVFGARTPGTLMIMNNLALLYQSQGRYADAEPLFTKTLQLTREVLGARHPDTLSSMNNLALLYQSQGRYADAEPLLAEVLQLTREVLGPRHPDT